MTSIRRQSSEERTFSFVETYTHVQSELRDTKTQPRYTHVQSELRDTGTQARYIHTYTQTDRQTDRHRYIHTYRHTCTIRTTWYKDTGSIHAYMHNQNYVIYGHRCSRQRSGSCRNHLHMFWLNGHAPGSAHVHDSTGWKLSGLRGWKHTFRGKHGQMRLA